MTPEQFLEQFRVTDNDPRDGGFGRILDTQGEHDDARFGQHFDHLEEGADPVGEEDGILAHGGSLKFFGCLGHHGIWFYLKR